MMFSSGGAVTLNVTSRFMSACVCVRKASSVYEIKTSSRKEHDGFGDCEWFDPVQAEKCAREALSEVAEKSRCGKKRVYIGVPGEFSAVVNRDVSVRLDRERKVVDADIEYLIEKGKNFDTDGYTIINSSPVSFSLDASDKQYFDVRGMKACRVAATVSYLLCENSFAEMFTNAARKVGFADVRFVALPWAESIALFEREARSTPVLVADIGYLSSFAAVGVGFGLEDLASFSVGRGHIAAEIYEKLGVPYDLAERALELVDLNLAYSPTDILVADGGTHAVHAADAAETGRGVLRELAEFVSSVAESNNYPLRSTVYLTGDGITSLRGADKFLSEQIGRNVEICAPKLAGFNKPADSSEAALIIVAEQLRAESFGHQIKRAISGGKL